MKNYLPFCFLLMMASIVPAESSEESIPRAVKLNDLEMDIVTAGETVGLFVSSSASASGPGSSSSSATSSAISYDGQVMGYGSATTCCDGVSNGVSNIEVEFVPILAHDVQNIDMLKSKIDFLKLHLQQQIGDKLRFSRQFHYAWRGLSASPKLP